MGVAGFKSLELRGPLAPSWADALYLVIGTLTTSGIGDVVPRSRGARTFIAVYSLIGTLAFARLVGALALRPLEKARREAQLAVLSRYTGRAGRLTQQSLEELARGALVKQLALSADDACCSRDEFTLLTLAEMGKITEADLVQCRPHLRRSTWTSRDISPRTTSPSWRTAAPGREHTRPCAARTVVANRGVG